MSSAVDPYEDQRQVVEQIRAGRDRIDAELSKVIIGQKEVITELLISLFAGGHCLITGAPGLAKTLLVCSIAQIFDLKFRRIQFTPDLMPADILGSEILEETTEGRRAFRFVRGPIFAQLLMADEINRASPRTQSALLQAMQEQHVTIAGQRYDLPKPFHVLATQNPLEQEGTYPLPEAQLDRFIMQIDVLYPDLDAERRMLFETTGARQAKTRKVFDADRLMQIQSLVRRMPVGDQIVDAILGLVRSIRPGEAEESLAEKIAWGPGPRASQALMLTVRARALLDGRLAPSPDDIATLAIPVLQHRMAVTFAARADGISVRDLVDQALEKVL